MAIPGLRPSFEVRGKVRVGEKGRTAGGKEYPKSTDYFVFDDAELLALVGEKPKELTVMLPFERPEDNFSTGLEQWQGAMLVCYTKGEQVAGRNAAFRRATMKKGGREVNLLEGFETLSDRVIGNERRAVACLDRDCPIMQKGDCKPMGRLQFFVKGISPSKGVFQIDTKSWNSIEKIEAFLSVLGDPRGQELTLRVEMWSKGTSKFPVIHLEGGNVVVTDETVPLADALVQLHRALSLDDEPGIRVELAGCLDITNPGWRQTPAIVDRIKDIGLKEAAKGLLARHNL